MSAPTCYGWCEHTGTVTHIGDKGYVYCTPCAQYRRVGGSERVRRMRPWELRLIESGKPVPSYQPISKKEYESTGGK
jgi:hypothetical protein